MRYLLPVQATLAGLLLLPVFAGQGPSTSGASTPGAPALQRALDDTVRALEDLAGLRERMASERPRDDALTQIVVQALRRTEPPFSDAPALDRRLVELRDEVSRLEELLGRMVAQGSSPIALPPLARGGETGRSGIPTTGLDSETRAQLARILPAIDGAQPFVAPPAADGIPRRSTALESEDFTADGLRLARAYYRAGRFTEALSLLPEDHAEPEVRWWRGRTLERLQELEAADECWRALAADAEAGVWAERAKADLEFLEWKRARVVTPRAESASKPESGPR